VAMMTDGDSPMAEQTPPAWQGKILHAYLTVGDMMLMGSDTPPNFRQPQVFSVSQQFDDAVEAQRIFQSLADNSVVKMPLRKIFWVLGLEMVIDRLDNQLQCSALDFTIFFLIV
jgi:PhnB protein